MRLTDFPCLLISEHVTATSSTNILALDLKTPNASVKTFKLVVHKKIFPDCITWIKEERVEALN